MISYPDIFLKKFMNINKIAIESLSMDLQRAAIGYHRGSISMAKRFSEEALKRIYEIQLNEIKPYFVKILNKIKKYLLSNPNEKTAEDALMYSILCRNYAQKYL
jgi:hypothetical protein